MKNNKNKKELKVFFILDKSGSMAGSVNNTISSYNEYLERERKNKYKTYISTLLFSDKVTYLYKDVDISKVNDLTCEDYVAFGCTALYDAIGMGINDMDKYKDKKVLFIIITDGYENASTKYNRESIKELINSHSNWEFIYIGADIDAFKAGGDIGIKKENIANYRKDRKGTSLLFKSVGKFEEAMLCESMEPNNWKDELEEYIKENK